MGISKKDLLGIHKWLGLIAGLFILVMAFSGSLLVFDDEIEHYLQRDVIYLDNSQDSVNIDAAYHAVQEKYPNWGVRISHIPDTPNRAIEAQVRRPDLGRRILYIHPTEATILRDLHGNETFSYWLLNLHYKLHAGFWGEVLLFFAGLCFIGSLITGFWFYRKSIWRVLTFKIRPRFRNLHSGSSELHRCVGVWVLLMNLLMALTGILLSLIVVGTNVYQLAKGEQKPIPDPPSVTVSLDNLIDKSTTDLAGFTPTYIEMPPTAKESITIFGGMDTDWPIHYEFSNHIEYNPQTGEETERFLIREKHWSYHILSVAYPLHFGNWGGVLTKLIYCVAGLAPPILSITGFIIWRRRRTQRIQVAENNFSSNPIRSK
ncbi:PepSY-associated TM helix domain-containing protein [Fodinibius sp. Rm-B-1B1-1]|uniref:PepSY-associated TM helix domain-containing protein n=1 Tax=Fodinibius alkaliphilus TaxID=3140241 RepID=UPI00315A6C3D